ncbi:MAG: hypothetical protein HWD61_13775 [Parachlamydiaceae bacterium]|nr:MAG: hypothetical protein HWD61_13775 [Parachlamydiaceae bacterium]
MLKTASLGPVISETIEKEQWELLKVLVENGVNVDDHKTDNGTPLYKLLDSEEVDYSAALYLVQNGALLNLNLKEYDFSPLMLAILSLKKESPVEAEELIKSMVSKGASLAKDEAKNTLKTM